MVEAEAVPKEVSILSKPVCNDTNNHNKASDIDNFYVGVDAVDSKDFTIESGKTRDPHIEEETGVTLEDVQCESQEEACIKTKRKPFNFLIKVPRFDDEDLREEIRLAKLNIDEKTKLRDDIQVQIQERRANAQIHGIDYEYAKGESRNARKSLRSIRMEIESLHSVINKAKNALSIDDIDTQIFNMEHMIQHETLQLKEEKQLIREINQLTQLREELSSNMGNQDEIKKALEQMGEAEVRVKILRKELNGLKSEILKAEAAAVEAGKKYDDKKQKVWELQDQFRASNEVHQAAYVQWQSLRKELSMNSEYFLKYKDDLAIASNYVYSRDTDELYRVCMNNVETFMELWNTDVEFRINYTKFNARSTVQRPRTLDGRALGSDESPPALLSHADARANTIVPILVKVTEELKLKKSREEIEAIKKADEMEMKEAESKLKEQRRLEALAKASDARERKIKQPEKLQMRAELKTLKEAEQKEKVKLKKKLRKLKLKKCPYLWALRSLKGTDYLVNRVRQNRTRKDCSSGCLLGSLASVYCFFFGW